MKLKLKIYYLKKKITKDKSGTTKEFYDLYFKNKNNAVAYQLGEVKIYDILITLSDLNINFIPQSFIYLD